ncbi:methionine-rich copper-binding protein CopC [Microterricola gilva]|uniref:Methionine-rich copper-binding protein CopC n=1 Tax=Microterricola gilva TaxID=393267 RepID=A0A4Q8AHT5_9MICO|nr:copper resistance CopC family protein [Microterricola gilva]RZU63962.1 methionine-rich copper-binding protein CopC [Microterricola gilva]
MTRNRFSSGRGLRQRAACGAAIAALVLGTAVFGAAAPASAHNQVLDTVPAADAVVTEQPGTFSVTTSDAILDAETGNAMVVSGPASAPRYYGEGCGVVTGPTLSLDAQLGEPGIYTVTWRAISVDSHVISESYEFEWAPDAGVQLAEGTVEPSCAAASGQTGDAPESGSDAGTEGETAPAAELSNLLWIGGALGAALIAVLVTVLVLRRRQ